MRFGVLSIAVAAVVMTAEARPQQSDASSRPAGAPSAVLPGVVPPAEVASVPVLQHVAASGATLTDVGQAHGVRTVVARHEREFMILGVPEDGEVAVAGLEAELSVPQLLAIAGDRATDLGTAHGMRVLFVRNGDQFQVFYGTPDGERVIPGVMWDAHGKNLTREQVAGIEGTIPTVVIGPEKGVAASKTVPASHSETLPAARATEAPSNLVKDTHYGIYGQAGAPRLWVFIDPLCSYSIKAMAGLDPYVASGKVELAIIPLAVLDYEDGNRSTPSALAMLSKPPAEMVAAWRNRGLDAPSVPDAAAALKANMAVAEAIALKGTPTLVWRKADGTEGRIDGVPGDIEAVVSSLGRPAP